METKTFTRFFFAIGARRSRSRSTRADLVTIVKGCSHSARISTICRVILNFLSIGW